MKPGLFILLSVCALAAQPHPETGLEFWAIQAEAVPGEIVAFGRIEKLTFLDGGRSGARETRIELRFDRVLRGGAVTTALLVEPGDRFNELLFNRDVTGTFLFHLQPSTLNEGFIAYWNGFGVRETTAGEFAVFERRFREWADRKPDSDRAVQRVRMLEWGLTCAEHAVTRWEGVLAIRDAVHPGEEFRDHARAMKAVTPERWQRIRRIWNRVRDEKPRDHRIGTVMMEALAWMTPDPLFHHEVRHWSAKLRLDTSNWPAHFDGFWREFTLRRED